MITKLALLHSFAARRRSPPTATPANDNRVIRRFATGGRPMPRRALACHWQRTPSGALESKWGLAEPKEDDMSTLGRAVLQAAALWFHLGIEPLLGGGPTVSSHKTQSRRIRAVLPREGETCIALPKNKTTRRARLSNRPSPNTRPHSRSAIAKRDAA
jgi:hypothetical protein